MENSDNLITLIDNINRGMDILFSIAFALLLVVIFLVYTYKRIKKDGPGKGIFLGVLVAVQEIFFVFVIWIFPNKLAAGISKIGGDESSVFVIRWMILYMLSVPLAYFLTRKQSGRRALYASLFILTTFLFGWLYDRWIGIIFISTPLFIIFLHLIDRMAQISIPASNPEDKEERWKKSKALLFYLLGIQYPIWIVPSKVGREFETRVDGDYFKGVGGPGIVWTWPHQVTGLSAGIEFNQVDGPGTLFTAQYERPVALVDLRTQLRVSEVDAVTKDGMPVTIVVFMSFAIDREAWPKKGWPLAEISRLKYINPLLSDAMELDHLTGSYPYSSKRVRAVLSTIGINSAPQQNEIPAIQWDEGVVKQIEHGARQIVSQRSLDELWRPRIDGLRLSALDEMASDLKVILEPKLREVGVNLFTARVVNFKFDKESEIPQQQINTWSTYWAQRISEAHADAEAIYRAEIEKAHAFAKSVLLDGIAESIEEARQIDPNLPKHVIAQYYIHALEDYIKEQPGADNAEAKQRIKTLKEFLLYRTEGNE